MYFLHELLEQSAVQFSLRPALLFKDQALTYHELNRKANQLAHLLILRGVKPGDRVGVFFDKGLEQVFAIWAVVKVGAIFVILDPLLKEAAIQHIINDCGVSALIASSAKLTKVSLNGLPTLDKVFYSGDFRGFLPAGTDATDVSGVENLSVQNPVIYRKSDEELVSIIYTSGSTGSPKGVMLTHKNITLGAQSVSQYLEITKDDKILSLLPFSFDYGLNQMMTAFKEGALLVLKNYIFPEEIVEIISSVKITGLAGVPVIWIQLLQAKNLNQRSLKSLRYITNSGDRLSVPHVQALKAVLPATKIYLMYGLTEAFRATYLDPSEIDRRPDSIGKAVPYAEVFVVNAQGCETGPDEIGELIQSGPLLSKGYWGKPEDTALKIRPHPFRKGGGLVCYSGDLVRRDKDGFLYYVGRNSAMIKSLGHRISPTEIETELYKHPAVKQAVAFGVKHDLLGEKIVAVVSYKKEQQLGSEELQTFCKKMMPHYMIPSKVITVDSMPLTSSGKLDRTLLKERYGSLS